MNPAMRIAMLIVGIISVASDNLLIALIGGAIIISALVIQDEKAQKQ